MMPFDQSAQTFDFMTVTDISRAVPILKSGENLGKKTLTNKINASGRA